MKRKKMPFNLLIQGLSKETFRNCRRKSVGMLIAKKKKILEIEYQADTGHNSISLGNDHCTKNKESARKLEKEKQQKTLHFFGTCELKVMKHFWVSGDFDACRNKKR